MRLRFELGVATLSALVGVSCLPEPARPVVSELRVEGVRAVDRGPVVDGLSTTQTERLLGIEGVFEYRTYDPHVLGRDLLRIERYLRARGYYEAKVTVARVVHLGNNRVRIVIRVNQGLPVRIARLDPGLARLPWELALAANRAREMAEGDLLDEDLLEQDKRRILKVLLELGRAFASVTAKARVDLSSHAAHVTYQIDVGLPARYGPVTLIGLREIPRDRVLNALQIREGESYSESALEEARQALIDLGVFSTVDVVPDRSRPESGIVPIEVRIQESALRTLRVGGGVRFDVLRLMVRAETSWEHKNFLGGLRGFLLQARPGVTLFPTRIDRFEKPTRFLLENVLSAELRQPSFLEGRTTGRLKAEYSVAPLLYPLPDEVAPEAEPIIGYQEIRASTGLERWFFGHLLWVQPSFNVQANYPFTYQQEKPEGLEPVRVWFPQLVTTFDLRDNPVRTRSGLYVSNTLQVAGHGFGGGVDDVQIRPEARFFTPIDRSVLALRLSFGFLFPSGYGNSLTTSSTQNALAVDPAVVRDQQILNLRAFYSGGPNSNRGYPLRTVGPHGPVGFLVPSNSRGCINWETTEGCMRPLGGVSLWEASIEARIPFPGDTSFEAVLFMDASDLTREVGQIRLNVPHISPGIGLRYLTPIGPLRLDVGWRVPSLQAIGKNRLPEGEGRPGEDLFGLFPGAAHLVFGTEAF